ncbi:3'-5' exoribonuclease [Hydrogenovibrio sp. 3SP14C1]|uniref:3'-5' exonuclease n=1 Tax=Hydrogenovibrio sp. 3SP14C1 TaxID=3038774 RepID=UPI002415DD1E|nr:3'-5' exonuclease [Hydrogenovibrio sp. 3SP14C1]MDG4811913.1 3'-5' exoribonuclease [Hydrogenovibrio sp. 3SP14C1]
MIQAMIDIEALGLKHKSVIASIGIVIFDAVSIKGMFHIRLDVAESAKLCLDICDDTVAWWSEQSDEARTELDGTTAPLVAVKEAFDFLLHYKPERIYARSPQFDLEMLKHHADVLGLDVPWHFRQEMDHRTYLKAYEETLQLMPHKADEKKLVKHNAVDDALIQAYEIMSVQSQAADVQKVHSSFFSS